MWTSIWPGVAAESLPIRAITNGVHASTWVAAPMGKLFEEQLGTEWRERLDEPEFWDRVLDIPDEALWKVRLAMRGELFRFIQERARERWTKDKVSAAAGRRRRHAARSSAPDDRLRPPVHGLQAARPDLPRPGSPRGSSRRRGGRCRSSSPASRTRPTTSASTTCSRSTGAPLDPTFGGRIAFVDDYDLHVAHYLVHGCDVWLNTPAEAARGERHERDEGRHQRHPAPQHRRRLVGGGLQRHERLADRRARADGDDQAPVRRGRRRGALHAARTAGRSVVLRAGRAGHAAGLAPHGQGGHPEHHAGLHHAADDEAVRRGALPARPSRRRCGSASATERRHEACS